MGDGGILTRATNARKTNDIAGVKEQVELKTADYSYEYLQKKYVNRDTSVANAGIYVCGKIKSDPIEGYSIAVTESTTESERKITLTKTNEEDITGTIKDDGSIEWEDNTSGGTGSGVSITIVNDANSNNEADVGDEVTIGNEHFYVMASDATKLTLLAKYNLATSANLTTGKYEQQNANNAITGCPFSNSDYWSADWESGTEIDLNTWDAPENKSIPITENVNNNAILRARKYGQDLGGTGRLLTYSERNTLSDSIMSGFYSGDERVGGSDGDGSLQYWLGEVYPYTYTPGMCYAMRFVRRRYVFCKFTLLWCSSSFRSL